jgi:hypothetical protein
MLPADLLPELWHASDKLRLRLNAGRHDDRVRREWILHEGELAAAGAGSNLPARLA